ncbi:hypothetical protein DJ531_11760, partial [Sulfolobus sp. A20-N-F6]
QLDFSVTPLQRSLSVGENTVTLIINKSQVPIYNLSLMVNSAKVTVNNNEANVSLFVSSYYYLSFYPLTIKAYYLTPYGNIVYSKTIYLFVNQTRNYNITYDVVSSPNPSYLIPGKNLIMISLNNTFGVTFYRSYVTLMINNGTYTSKLVEYLNQWEPNQTINLYTLVYSSHPISIEAFVSNISENITELDKIIIPVKNLDPIQVYYYHGNLTVINNLKVPIDNLTIYGITFNQIPPNGKVTTMISNPYPLVNITYYVNNYQFMKSLIINVSQSLNVSYTFINGQLELVLYNSYLYPITNVYVVSNQLNPHTYYLTSLGENASTIISFQPLSGNISLKLYYYVNGTEYVKSIKLSLGNINPDLALEKYQIVEDGNAFIIVLYVKNIGNISAYNSYILVSSSSISYVSPSMINLGQLSPNEEVISYSQFSSNSIKFKITVTLLYSNGTSVMQKNYTINVINNNTSPIIKYISLGLNYLGYSVYHVPVIFIVGIVILLAIVLFPRNRS